MWIVNQAQATGLWWGGQANLTADEMGEALLSLQRRWLADGKPLRMLLASYFDGKPEGGAEPHPAVRYTADTLECPETRERVFLLPDGRLLPCPGFAGTAVAESMPSLSDASLAELLSDSALSHFCGESREKRLASNPQCQRCAYFEECGMGCRAYALTENGSIHAPDPRACNRYKRGWQERFARMERQFSAKEGLHE